jgi:hypothetical protein
MYVFVVQKGIGAGGARAMKPAQLPFNCVQWSASGSWQMMIALLHPNGQSRYKKNQSIDTMLAKQQHRYIQRKGFATSHTNPQTKHMFESDLVVHHYFCVKTKTSITMRMRDSILSWPLPYCRFISPSPQSLTSGDE